MPHQWPTEACSTVSFVVPTLDCVGGRRDGDRELTIERVSLETCEIRRAEVIFQQPSATS
eukprot:scaffold1038_cov81-Cyclotella_meneghiniana.AAC.1